MTLYADDPDVSVTFEVTDSAGQNDITPAVVKVAGYNDITAAWIGDPAPVRKLKIPLYGLPPYKWLRLSLKVPGENDVEFDRVIMQERVAGLSPISPTTAQLFNARITALENSAPSTLRRAVLLARPTSFSRTRYVDAAGPDDPAANKFRTITAALDACRNDAEAKALAPDQWQRVIVAPGSYEERVVAAPWTAILGDSENPADVEIHADENTTTGTAFRCTYVSDGASCWLANVTVRYTGVDEFWHPMRDGGYPMPYASVPRTVVCENVVFTVPDNAPVDCQVLDIQPSLNTFMGYFGCTFIGRSLPQTINSITNAIDEPGQPSTLAFVDCHNVCSTLTWINNPVNAYNLDTMETNVVGLLDGGGPNADRVVWIGGTFETGTASNNPAAPRPAAGNVWVHSADPTPVTRWIIDPNVDNINITGTAAPNVVRRVDPLYEGPTQGVTPAAHAHTLGGGSSGGSWTQVAADNFTHANGTALVGTTANTGQTWVAASNPSMTVQNNKAGATGAGLKDAALPLGSPYNNGLRVTVDYDTTANAYLNVGFFCDLAGVGTNRAAKLELVGTDMYGNSTDAGLLGLPPHTTIPSSGTLVLTVLPDRTLTVSVNGSGVASTTMAAGSTLAGSSIFLAVYSQNGDGREFDNLVVERIA